MKEKDIVNDIENEEVISPKNDKEKKNEFFDGIESEEFDIKTKFESTTLEQLEDLSNKEGLSIDYSFNGVEITEGLKLFQKETIYKKNMIYTLILIVIFTLYMIGLVKNPTNFLSMFLSTLCVALVGFIWYLPANHAKKIAKAADSGNLKFNMTVYEDCVKIGENDSSFILTFNNEITKIYETVDLYILTAGKERIFILPKRFLDAEQNFEVREKFKSAMKEYYIAK